MGRWTQYDEDSSRLPEGMQRIGYDADTQRYTFKDTDGSIWVSAPGSEFGILSKVRDSDHMFADTDSIPRTSTDQNNESWEFESLAAEKQYSPEKDVKASWRLLAPFLLLVCLVPISAFWFLGSWSNFGGSMPVLRDCAAAGNVESVVVRQGDTCWDISEKHAMTLDQLKTLNQDLVCERLRIGEVICVTKTLAT